jgi:hypothetical protein
VRPGLPIPLPVSGGGIGQPVLGSAARAWWLTTVAAIGSHGPPGTVLRDVPAGGVGLPCLASIKEVVLGSFPRQDETFRMLVPFDLAGQPCSESLRQRTPLGNPCLEIDGSGGFRSCAPMFLSVWFQRERFVALQAVSTMEHAFLFHGASGECQ